MEDEIREIVSEEVSKYVPDVVFPKVQDVNVLNFNDYIQPQVNVTVPDFPEIPAPIVNVPEANITVQPPEVTVNVPDFPEYPETIIDLSKLELGQEETNDLLEEIKKKLGEKYKVVENNGGTPNIFAAVNAINELETTVTNGTQKTQIVDSEGDSVNVTHQGYLVTRASEDSMFNDVVVVERNNLIELKSNVNIISTLRDITTETDGTVTASNGEYVLATTATANATVKLDSAEIGRYQPGYAAECGIGVRASGTMTGEMEQRWGYYNNNDGFYFGRDATGVFIAYKRAGGAVTKVYQSNWNGDNLSGNNTSANSSGQTLNVTDGNIFQIRFAWYGYGVVEWRVVTTILDTGEQATITVHRYKPTGSNSIANPNLPIRTEVLNGATATAHTLYIAGRQFSILGKYSPRRRVTSQYKLLMTDVGTTFLPTVSFRRKTTRPDASVKIESFDVVADADVITELRLNGSLTNPSYITPTNHTANETAVEADVSATAITGGEVLYQGLVSSTGTGVNSKGSASVPLVPIDLINNQPVTVCVRKLTGTGATVSVVFRVTEEW